MSLDALVEGIRKHIAQGDSPDAIRSIVLDAGYTPEEFADAFARAMALDEAAKVSAVPHAGPVVSSSPVLEKSPQAVVSQVSEAEREETKSPMLAIVLLILLTFFVFGAVGFYILNPDFLRDFALSRIQSTEQ